MTATDERPARGRRTKPPRWPILLVVVGALVAAAVVQQQDTSSSAPVAPAVTAQVEGASVPPADAVSTSWFCAEGTSSAKGRADETVIVGNLSSSRLGATITVMPGGDAAPVSRVVSVAPGGTARVPVSDILATAEPGVVVEVVGGRAVVSHELRNGSDFALEPCTRSAATDWYFAAGTTVKGAAQYLVLFNPFGDDAIVDVSFVTDTGVQQPDDLQGLVVPRRSRVSVAVQDLVPRQDRVATEIHARSGRLVAERTLIFDGTAPDSGPTRQGIAVSLGATAPSRIWRLPAGTTADGGSDSVAVANFGQLDTTVEVNVALPGGQTLAPQTVKVPSRGVVAVDATGRIPAGTAYAVTVTSRDAEGNTGPVVAESLASWPAASTSTGVASTLGSQTAARRWVVLVPDIDADAIITVLNPGATPVTASLLPASEVDRKLGPTSEPELAIGRSGVATFAVPGLSGSGRGALVVTATHPIVVGLTVLGRAGASTSAAFPDLGYTG